ncbi:MULTISPECIES: efflux RND transporter periplasmic adaptor subunit [Brevibacillus]|uniref:Efflux RND transporter periplasmic adaptor subunit n=1 Tax=Brevibacillus porteri TaxID=2126350 RepID=A0ABX5FWK6_9BACL|nr:MULTISPECIES: efflux RND transporter periplasmic adaptor subunit [Brevibacillus]MDC0759163.1 efflux RND transporter periplasmic adaptor subunit [Brevibacillus sp. AG]MED1798646.1 efflux RND transporter periplasmic adaptor subunit [Brevibacillus porteri]MED2131329.1 efflux RND transporter periplasmic adaptor subunit [Brevibacillus porteri]MED2743884.1 efflux RND transporter periplasmic adaptor subunit [Brevibacillus porteri]MED2813613.1 efflux RND transporter periplasmic adaptor subunit [Bre
MKLNKKPVILALLAISLVAGCSSPQAETPPTETVEASTPVQIETVATGTVVSDSGLTAKLAPSEEVQVSPKMGGKISSLPVKLGQYVTKGQVLFKLDEKDLVNSVKQAEAAYNVSKASLNQAGSSSDQGLVQAKNSLKQAETALQDAKVNQQRMQQLFSQGAISAQQMEQANSQLTTAQTSYDNAQQGVQSAGQKTSVQVSEASVQQAQVSLQNAREQLANATVTSPINGYISSVSGAVGQMAGQQPVVVVVNTNPLLVKANLSEADITKIKVGTTVKVNVQSTGKTIDAKVTAMSPVMDTQLKAYPVEITIPNPSNELKSDMVVNVTFPTVGESGAKSIVVTRGAVFDRDGKQYVFKLEGDIAKQVEVTTGKSSSDTIEILTGLSAGDKIVVKGQTLLQDGGKVTIQ